MSRTWVFIDDFAVAATDADPSGVVGDGLGYMAAVISETDYEAFRKGSDRIRVQLEQVLGAPVGEFHGSEIIGRKAPWDRLGVPTRARIFHDLLEEARKCSAWFIYEFVNEGDAGFAEVRRRFTDELPGVLPPSGVRRWGPDGDADVSIAAVARHAALDFAVAQLDAREIVLVEDKGVPLDQGIMDEKLADLAQVGVSVAPRWGQRSEQWIGLQLADMAAMVLQRAIRVRRKLEAVTEGKDSFGDHPFERFGARFVGEDTIPLLELGTRTLRAVDLNVADTAQERG